MGREHDGTLGAKRASDLEVDVCFALVFLFCP